VMFAAAPTKKGVLRAWLDWIGCPKRHCSLRPGGLPVRDAYGQRSNSAL
jgi:hypothetical protein